MKPELTCGSARDLLLEVTMPVAVETVPLDRCGGRVLARDLRAAADVPPFDRSPYDGYALRAEDTAEASRERPVTLDILEEVPAGSSPTKTVIPGTAVKVLTGSPIPPGADVVVKFEETRFTDTHVTLFAPLKAGDNIVRTGEDVKKGQVLAEAGTVIDAGLAGSLAAQGVAAPAVFRRPRIGLISTGNELVEPGGELTPGMIYDSNRYTFTALLESLGCLPEHMGYARDRAEEVAALLERALGACDAVLLTGGVSVGDYDCTPAAMERAGVTVLGRGVDMKPGMACAYGVKDGVPVWGLSGNPASSLTNFYAVVLPAVRKLCGRREWLPREFPVILADGFPKKSKGDRLLRGRLDLSGGTARMRLVADQGNIVLSSAIGCDVMAIIPAGQGPLEAGTVLKGFML